VADARGHTHDPGGILTDLTEANGTDSLADLAALGDEPRCSVIASDLRLAGRAGDHVIGGRTVVPESDGVRPLGMGVYGTR